MMIGTVLPTVASIAATERYYRTTEANKISVAKKKLSGTTKKNVGMETRYYKTETKYAIVNNAGKILWFVVRADGDYAVKE